MKSNLNVFGERKNHAVEKFIKKVFFLFNKNETKTVPLHAISGWMLFVQGVCVRFAFPFKKMLTLFSEAKLRFKFIFFECSCRVNYKILFQFVKCSKKLSKLCLNLFQRKSSAVGIFRQKLSRTLRIILISKTIWQPCDFSCCVAFKYSCI